jgi:hypothetical protein
MRLGSVSIFFSLVIVLFGYIWRNHLDILITLAPMYYDAYLVRALFSRKEKNTGTTSLPRVTSIIPSKITMENLDQVLKSDGYPILIKKIMNADQDKIVETMIKGNGGRIMRMFDFANWKIPHFSSSCSPLKLSQNGAFDEYARNHLYKNVSSNHSTLYAGFESITDVETINFITGLDIEKLGDYRLNNLFTSNFDREILTAPLHCAPIDSISLQLVGSKTWFFVSPEELATIPNVPMPTAFTLPLTDDQLLSKIKNVYAVKQGPGDLIYFGPHWCHVVSTSAGPNLMLNMRYNALDKVKKGPVTLLFKLLLRRAFRPFSGRPQDNLLAFPLLYDDLNGYYENCGVSESFNKIYDYVLSHFD